MGEERERELLGYMILLAAISWRESKRSVLIETANLRTEDGLLWLYDIPSVSYENIKELHFYPIITTKPPNSIP